MLYVLIIFALAFILSIFQLVSSIQKRDGVGGSTIFLIITLVATIFSGIKVADTAHHNKVTAQEAKHSKMVNKVSLQDNKIAKINESSQKAVTQGLKEDQFTKVLAKSFKGFGDVNLDSNSKTFFINPNTTNNKNAFNQLAANPSLYSESDMQLKAQFTKISANIKKQLGKGYTIQLSKPDTKEALMKFKDGKITYSIF